MSKGMKCNGTSVTLDTDEDITGFIPDGQVMKIGEGFNSIIDEVKLFNRVLTPSEIISIM